MKRQMAGGAHRGPVAPNRQRRTIRFVQLLLVLAAAGFSDVRVNAGVPQNFLERRNIARQLLIESLLLSTIGGAAGLYAAFLRERTGVLLVPPLLPTRA